MYYALVHFPAIDTQSLDKLRRKYDPQVNLIGLHITVMFPTPDTVGEAALISHLEGVLSGWCAFPIHLHGLTQSWDHWLFLTLEEGGTEIVQLYHAIYTDLLAPYRRADIAYTPHISLGRFTTPDGTLDQPRYEAALQEAEALGLDFCCGVDTLDLIGVAEDFSHITLLKQFSLPLP